MMLRNILIALAVAALAGFVFADALPDHSTLSLTDSSGTVIGSGSYSGGDLSLTVNFDGTAITNEPATVTVTNNGGETRTYNVLVSVDSLGNVTITLADSGQSFAQINPSIAERGGTVQFCSNDGSNTVCTTPSMTLPGPNEHANANASERGGNKNDGMNNASDKAREGEGGSNANAHAGNGAGNASH